MADSVDLCVRPDMDENMMRLPISPEKPADVASPCAISSSIPEAAKNNDEEFKKVDQSHGEVLETSWKLSSCGNRSSKCANTEQEVSRYRACNRVIALQGDKNDADCTRSNDRCEMHEHLLFDIMLWLPVISLLRFRSVCRLWRSLIDSSTFITQHYNHNSNKNCLIARHVSSPYGADYESNFCLLSGNKYAVYSNLDYEQPWYSVKEVTILNSCNGIVSLFNKKSGNVALWNPATKQLRPLPKSSSIPPRYPWLTTVRFGFGFDAKSSDYKFVKILYQYQNKHDNLVEVYSLRTDSWRTIHKHDVLPFGIIDSHVTTCKKGTCFWTGYTYHDEFSPILISFDLNKEVFETMLLPGQRDADQCDKAYNDLDLLNDKLCYIKGVNLGPFDLFHTYFEIWMLDEYGVKESWKKICKFGPTGTPKREPPCVLGIAKNGEFLLLGGRYRHREEAYLSNFDARGEEHAGLENSECLSSKYVSYSNLQNPNPLLMEFVCYNESLVSLKKEDGSVAGLSMDTRKIRNPFASISGKRTNFRYPKRRMRKRI